MFLKGCILLNNQYGQNQKSLGQICYIQNTANLMDTLKKVFFRHTGGISPAILRPALGKPWVITGADHSTCIMLHETTHKRGQSMQRERAQGNLSGVTKGCCFIR